MWVDASRMLVGQHDASRMQWLDSRLRILCFLGLSLLPFEQRVCSCTKDSISVNRLWSAARSGVAGAGGVFRTTTVDIAWQRRHLLVAAAADRWLQRVF